jgi:hypothetical protein
MGGRDGDSVRYRPGSEDLIFVEMFKSNQYEDVSMNGYDEPVVDAFAACTRSSAFEY